VGLDNVGGLLSPIYYSHGSVFNLWLLSTFTNNVGAIGNFCFFKLIFKPASLLLENETSEASSKNHDKTGIMFVGLISKDRP